jgi:hypothetical protein
MQFQDLQEESRGYYYGENLAQGYVVRMPIKLAKHVTGGHVIVDALGFVHVLEPGWRAVRSKPLQ